MTKLTLDIMMVVIKLKLYLQKEIPHIYLCFIIMIKMKKLDIIGQILKENYKVQKKIMDKNLFQKYFMMIKAKKYQFCINNYDFLNIYICIF